MPPGNPFATDEAAKRYAAGRPDVHALFVRRIVGGLGGPGPRRTLDIGCGTGLSTRPLAAAFGFTVGLDVSGPMLTEARRRGVVHLVRGRGETLPFPAGAFDLVAIACTFHWCEPKALEAELLRVLRLRGHLAVFDHFLAGRMEDEPRFAEWCEAYKRRFPPPPRNPAFDPARLRGFARVAHEDFEHVVALSLDALVSYITSQSNILAGLAAGMAAGEVVTRVRADLAPFFRDRAVAGIVYGGTLDLLRRS